MKKNIKTLISIIIPVYNCEKHLGKCLESVINQSYTNFEVILIDDGSTDQSEEVYNYYQNIDNRIKVIKQKNQGVSCARNKGLETSKGEYILFLDSDDMIDKNMLSKMYENISINNADIAFCGFQIFGSHLRENDTHVLTKICAGNKCSVITNEEAIRRTVSTNPNEVLHGYIWRNLYCNKILKNNNIKFSVGIKISEDFMFILEVLSKCEKVVIIPENLYIYNINDNSVTTKYINTLHNDMYFINQWMLENICEEFPNISEGYYCCVANTYLGSIQNVCRRGTPYSLIERIKYAYTLKKKYDYMEIIKKVWLKKSFFRKKAWIAMIFFRLHLDFIYIILFSLKQYRAVN